MATHSRVLAWRISGTGEPDGLLSMESHRVEHNWSDLGAAAAACCPLWFQGSPQTRQWECFLVFGNFSFKTPFLVWKPLCLSFYLLYFFLPPFEDSGLLFWVPDVLCRYSEVVLWNLLSVPMFFWWICGGESGLHIIFQCHLGTAFINLFCIYRNVTTGLSIINWLECNRELIDY